MMFVEVKEMKFSEKLQKLRKENKMSQEQLADQLEVSRQSVSKWESGQTYPEMDKLISICKIFKCSLDDLTNDDVKEIKGSEKEKVTVNKLIDEVLDTVSRSACILKKLSISQMAQYFLELILLITILILLRIPVDYIYHLGAGIFESFGSGISNFLCSIWNFLLSISYLIFSVICFYYLYKVLFLEKWESKNLEEKGKEKKELSKEEETVKEEPILVEKKKSKKQIEHLDKHQEPRTSIFQAEINGSVILKVLNSIVLFFAKMCTFLILLPFLLFISLIIILLILGIYFIFQEVLYFGVFFLLLGGFILCYLIIEILFNIIASRTNSSKRIGTLFLTSLIILGVGIGISLIEVSAFTYYDEIPNTTLYESEYIEKEIEIQDDFAFSIIGAYDEIEYIPDPELSDTVRFQIEMYHNFNKVKFEYGDYLFGNHYLYIVTEPKIHIFNPKMRKVILDSLRNKKFYNYGKLERIHVTVFTSQENIDKIHEYQKSLEEANRKNMYNQEINYYNSLLDDCHTQITLYESRIYEKENENALLQEKIGELELKLEEMKDKLQEYKNQISSILVE